MRRKPVFGGRLRSPDWAGLSLRGGVDSLGRGRSKFLCEKVIMSSLGVLDGFDPGGGDDADMRTHIEGLILKQKPAVTSLSCGVHLELVALVDTRQMTVKDCSYLHELWVTGR